MSYKYKRHDRWFLPTCEHLTWYLYSPIITWNTWFDNHSLRNTPQIRIWLIFIRRGNCIWPPGLTCTHPKDKIMANDLISNSWEFGITWNCTWPPVLNFPHSPPKDKNMTDDLISTIWGVQITCNCTRPPVEQPDHRRRLILAPKPSSALLYNTHPPLHLYVSRTKPSKLYSTNLPQLNTSLLRLNTRSSLYCSPFWVLRTQHRTRYCTLLSPAQQPYFCTTLGWRA